MMIPTRTHLWRDYEEVRFSIKVESIIHYKMIKLDTKKGPCKPAGPFLVTVHCFEIQIIRSIKFNHFMHIIFDFLNNSFFHDLLSPFFSLCGHYSLKSGDMLAKSDEKVDKSCKNAI